MTQRNTLQCVHEPFGDAFYFGPERLGTRYEDDEKARIESGFAESTYKSIFDNMGTASDAKPTLFGAPTSAKATSSLFASQGQASGITGPSQALEKKQELRVSSDQALE